MSIAATFTGIALNPLMEVMSRSMGMLDINDPVTAAVEQILRRLQPVEAAFRKALETTAQSTWRTLELLMAQEPFWERCIPLLEADDQKRFRDSTTKLAEFGDIRPENAFDTKACIREIGSARQTGQLALQEITLTALVRDAVVMGPFADYSETMAKRAWTNVQLLADECSASGYRELAYALPHRVEDSVQPLIALLAEYYFRQALSRAANLQVALENVELPINNRAMDRSLEMVARFLVEKADRIEIMMAALEQGVVGSTSPALDFATERSRWGKADKELYTDFGKWIKKIELPPGGVRSSDTSLIETDAEARAIGDCLDRYHALSEEHRRTLPALQNLVGRLHYVLGDYADALAEFKTVAQELSDPVGKGEVLANAYQSALKLRDWDQALTLLLAAVKAAPRLFVPFPLGKYQPLKIVGTTPFGVVFACERRAPKGKVLVKTLDEAEGEALDRLMADSKLLVGKQLPGIPQVHECAFVDPSSRANPYLVVDEPEGKSLAVYIQEHGTLKPAALALLGRELTQLLHGLHRENILHCNLSPASVYLRNPDPDASLNPAAWSLCLADTALAPKRWSKSGSKAPPTDPIRFASPEQKGELKGVELTPASDIHAMARVCAYALFQTHDPDDDALDRLPPSLAELLLDCLEEQPVKRPADCLSLLRRWEKLKLDNTAPPPAPAPAPKVAPAKSAPAIVLPDAAPEPTRPKPVRASENEAPRKPPTESQKNPAAKTRIARDEDDEAESPRPASSKNRSRDDDDDDKPRRNSSKRPRGDFDDHDDDDRDDEPTTGSGTNKGVIIGSVSLFVAALAVLIYFLAFQKKTPKSTTDNDREVAQVGDKGNDITDRGDPVQPKVETGYGPPPEGGDLSKVKWSKVYLSDLTETWSRDGMWPITKNGRLGNDGIGNGEANRIFLVKGKPSPKGISMHPPDNFQMGGQRGVNAYAFMQFRLMKVAKRFKAQVAVEDLGNPKADVFFEVKGDDNRLWAQGLKVTRQTLDIDIDVTGVDLLELRTYVSGTHHGAHAVWLDPYVTKAGIDPVEVKQEDPKKDPPFQEPPKKEDGPPPSTNKPTPVQVVKGSVYLADMEETDVQIGTWPFTKGGRLGNPVDRLAGLPEANVLITINGHEVPKALALMPAQFKSASVKYRLKKNGTRFFSEIALNDKAKHAEKGTSTFEVFGDGKPLWKSELDQTGKITKCDIGIADVDVLELRTSYSGLAPIMVAQAIWLNPKVTLRDDAVMPKKDDPAIVKVDPEAAKGKKIMLTYLKAHEAEEGMWPIARQGRIGIGKGADSLKGIMVGGAPAPDGISMHPGKGSPARMVFKVNKSAKSFIAQVGVDDSAFISRAANFEVYGDGKLVFLSDDISKNTKPQKVAVDISKYNLVELRTRMSENGVGEDCRAIWIDPYFIWDDTKPLPQREIYLVELQPFDVRPGPGGITVGKLGDPKAAGDLSIDDKPSKKGISMMPALKTGASIKFPLNRKYTKLVGKVGLNDSAELTPPKSSVVFEIYVDEKVVWTSKPVNKSRTLEEFDIDLKGAGVVQLRTKAVGGSLVGLHAVWVDPVAVLKDE